MENLKVTIIQTQLHWEKFKDNLSMLEEKISQINDTDLIVLPEMFNSGFTMNVKDVSETMDGETMQWLKSQAKKKQCVITGSLIIEEKGNYYNRLIWMQPDGSFKFYDKRHLFRMAHEDEYFTHGNDRVIVNLKGWNICLQVCYDLRFPVWSRNKNNEYDCLIYVANWPERRNFAWKTLLRARAIENQSYVIGVNRVGEDGKEISYSGDSAVINPLGEDLTSILPHTEKAETVILSKDFLDDYRKNFPAYLDADDFEVK